MGVIVACGLMVALGVAGVVAWGGCRVEPPWAGERAATEQRPSKAEVLRRYLWWVDLAVIAGLPTGLLVVGPGGRLVMRLLAVTAGDGAQGRLTEAEEVVGQITIGGTIGFVVFAGLFGGLMTGFLFVLLHRWLPGGRRAGLALGGLLLIVVATRIEPLRANNPDFDIVGPGWLAVSAFSAVVVINAMLVAAVAGRLSRALPLLTRQRRVVAAYSPLLLLALPGPVIVGIALVGAAVVVLSRFPVVTKAFTSSTTTIVGHVVLAGAVLVALPGFASTVADIARRG